MLGHSSFAFFEQVVFQIKQPQLKLAELQHFSVDSIGFHFQLKSSATKTANCLLEFTSAVKIRLSLVFIITNNLSEFVRASFLSDF